MFNCRYNFLSFHTDNSDVEDGSPPKRRRPLSSSGSDPNINKATAGSNV